MRLRLILASSLLAFILAWLARTDPAVPMVLAQPGLTWWAHPEPLSGHRAFPSQELRFRFTVQRQGVLQVAAMDGFRLVTGDTLLLEGRPGQDWKRLASVDVPAGPVLVIARHERLRPVVGLAGPAAPDEVMVEAQDGMLQPATPVDRLVEVTPSLDGALTTPARGFVLLTALVVILLSTRSPRPTPEPVPRRWLRLGVITLHVVLALINTARYPVLSGLDAPGHLDYARQIVATARIPAPSEGWMTYHPALYHALGAMALRLTDDEAVLQWISAAAGVGLLLAVAYGLGPGRWRGLALIALLPVLLLSEPQATNEVAAAALATVGLAVVANGRLTWRRCALAGLALGAGLQTKYTAVLILAAIVIAIALERDSIQRRLGLASVLLIVALGCGSSPYLERWRSYGDPFIGNWDDRLGHPYRQPPGVRTTAYFVSFGRALDTHPMRARDASLWDALYCTTFADGYMRFVTRPYQDAGMFALMWLALPLSACMLFGWGVAALSATPTRRDVLAVGATALVLAGLIRFNLLLPYWSTSKGVFLLSLALPAAWGFERGHQALRARGGPWLGRFLDLTLLTFAVTSTLVFVYRS